MEGSKDQAMNLLNGNEALTCENILQVFRDLQPTLPSSSHLKVVSSAPGRVNCCPSGDLGNSEPLTLENSHSYRKRTTRANVSHSARQTARKFFYLKIYFCREHRRTITSDVLDKTGADR